MNTKFVFFFTFQMFFASTLVASTYVFSVGSNLSFDTQLPTLKFAVDDSKRFADAMHYAGNIKTSNIQVIENANLKDFKNEFVKLNQRLQERSVQKLVFYFSGHSDKDGLHFSDGILRKAEFHQLLQTISLKTKVIILDSCFSGALTSKGIIPRQAFKIPTLSYDEPTGSVFLAATSSRNFAFESDLIKGSLFTNNLISGLYGAADGNKDGVVTTTELYEYSYKETKIQSFAQPNISIQEPEMKTDLDGKGAVVMSFPARMNGTLSLSENLSGLLAISHKKGLQFLRMSKFIGKEENISLPAGKYKIHLREENKIFEHDFDIRHKQLISLNRDSFVNYKMTTKSASKKGSVSQSFKVSIDGFYDLNRGYNIQGIVPYVKDLYSQVRLGAGYLSQELYDKNKLVSFRSKYLFVGYNFYPFLESFLELNFYVDFGYGMTTIERSGEEPISFYRLGFAFKLLDEKSYNIFSSTYLQRSGKDLTSIHSEKEDNINHLLTGMSITF